MDLNESLEDNTAQDIEMVENTGFDNEEMVTENGMAFAPLAAPQMMDNLWNGGSEGPDSDDDTDDYEYLRNEVS